MKRQFISMAMAGILVCGMSVTGYAQKYNGNPINTMTATAEATLSTGGTETAEGIQAYKALQNKLEAVQKQLDGAEKRLEKAKGKDKKDLENQINIFKKQIEKYKFEMKALLVLLNKADDR